MRSKQQSKLFETPLMITASENVSVPTLTSLPIQTISTPFQFHYFFAGLSIPLSLTSTFCVSFKQMLGHLKH